MKKNILTLVILLILLTGFARHGHALSQAQSGQIQKLLDDACRISGVPAMSVSIISGHETFYFSSGYADLEKGLPASENTLYELASVSKAFTGVGILLLEDQGLLSMEDPINKYLPWLTMNYKGIPLDIETLTLNEFMHHTSGLTNSTHLQIIPQGNTQDMLQKTVELLVDTELNFPPGDQYDYGTINYDVLGLVIELVSGQSYESFMMKEVFEPLGLNNTYLYKDHALASGQLAQGYRTSFFITSPYDAPDYAGNKPAGYIMSTTKDMARWMNIQMGLVEDIPQVYKRIIEKSHKGDMSVQDVNGMYYGAGWSVNADKTFVEHSGGNPNFSTQVLIFPDEPTAICLLTNSPNTNLGLADNIKAILDGNLSQSYKMSNTQLSDIVLSSVTIVFTFLSIIFFLLGLARKRTNKQKPIGKKRKRLTRLAWLTITIAILIMSLAYPTTIGYDWPSLLVWQTYSILTAWISLALLTGSITYFKYTS